MDFHDKSPVTRKTFPCDDAIMFNSILLGQHVFVIIVQQIINCYMHSQQDTYIWYQFPQ